jgi:hypothetical protein
MQFMAPIKSFEKVLPVSNDTLTTYNISEIWKEQKMNRRLK